MDEGNETTTRLIRDTRLNYNHKQTGSNRHIGYSLITALAQYLDCFN